MAKRIAQTTLNASTLDILNVIRQNASYEYQSQVPKIKEAVEIPKVGEVIYGTPALANQFLNALINRIALVAVQSATFYNPYNNLKKGYLEFGETVEEIFVNIAKVVEFDPEKAEAREFKRNLPDVRSAFHVMNWRVMYPVTIQNEDLKLAFLSVDGVTDLIAKIVDQVYTAAQYDEFLLFKYMLVKALSHGKIKMSSVGALTEMSQSAVEFRAVSNLLPFMSSDYNEASVLTTTPKDRQIIFMDARFNAKFDVEVLASCFNMDKADFMGRLYLIDNWTSFDNNRFQVIRENSDGIEEVLPEELATLEDVKAVLVDERWFQIYDNLNKFTETYVSSGLYWNYFYHTWKTVSHSPFSNAVAFVTDTSAIAPPDSVTVEILTKDTSEEAVVFTLAEQSGNPSLMPSTLQFVQTEALVKAGIAVQRYGAVIIPQSQIATEITLVATINGVEYTAATTISGSQAVGATVTMNKAQAAKANTRSVKK